METTESLVKRWVEYTEVVARCARDLSRVETALRNAANDLGKHMDPGDMADGETITCWVRVGHRQEKLLCTTKQSAATYAAKWRGKQRLAEEG